MILVAVDDFLFRSKIRTTGKNAGVELSFPRTPDEILEQARTLKPSLAIFDLNSVKMEPIARMKQDPELGSIRTLGFVSHVDSARIQAARAAGTDEVVARSTFATDLAEILLSDGTTRL